MSQNMSDLNKEIESEKKEVEQVYESSMETKINESPIDIEYGDIIQLISPSNSEYHEVIFFVNYIDNEKVKLINVHSKDLITLPIRPDSRGFTDESILSVYLLDRSKLSGYSRQKKLLPGVWVDIHFIEGKIPTITAEITDLEEDQIELTTYPALKIIYIDFAYRGIPEELSIEKFVIREKPTTLKNVSSLSKLREQVAIEEEGEYISSEYTEEATQQYLDSGESIINIPEGTQPDVNIKTAIREQFKKTQPKQGIVFGDYLEEVEQFVEVSEQKRRYNIDVQINSYMDELLSTIPYSERTTKVMNRIHILVERYKELREMYSDFDDAGNIKWLKRTDPKTHKPIIPHLRKMDVKLPWILPVVTNMKKIYEDSNNPLPEQSDIIKYDDSIIMEEYNLINDLYYNASDERNKYTNLYSQLNNSFMTPIDRPTYYDFISMIPVGTTTETIVENFKNINSSSINENELTNCRFLTQTYTHPQYYVTKELRYDNSRHYVQRSLTYTDKMYLSSLMTLPMPVMKYSQVFLPNTSLIDRVQLSYLKYMPFLFLNKRTRVKKVQVNDFSKELDFEKKEEGKESDTKEIQYLNTITQYILNPNLLEDEEKWEKYLQTVVPNTWVLLEFIFKYTKHSYTFKQIADLLEPFLIYEKDISYTQYKKIRYIIKEQIGDLKRSIEEKRREFSDYKNYKYQVSLLPPVLTTVFSNKEQLNELFDIGYNAFKQNKTNHEILNKILTNDEGRLFTLLLQSLMITLVTPESILSDSVEEDEWMNSKEKNEAKSCGTQILAKKYTKIDDLLKDNGHEDVFFDKDYDETNYGILSKYEKEKKEMMDEKKFADFLAENLVQKHNCNRDKSTELAQILIDGKKRVNEGQYAVLELKPKLPTENTSMEAEEKREVESEEEIRTKYTYYIRKKNQWVHDESLDEMAFMDSNTLFCNLKSLKCSKNNDKQSVDKSCEYAPEYFYKLERQRVLKEFERRYDISQETLEKQLENTIVNQVRFANRSQILRDIQRDKFNLLAYHLGLTAKQNEESMVVSPRASLLRIIYGQKDFIEKQLNILKFVEKFCRDPMIAERDEEPYWKYCRDTNTKLVPTFMYELANAFVHFGQEAYGNKLNEIISLQGIEEDGYIYDRYSHEVIKKIDNVEEQQYTDSGFRVITKSVIEQDIGSIVREGLQQKKKIVRVFENQLTEDIYTIYNALSSRIADFSEEIWLQVNQLSTEFASNTEIIKSEMVYKKESDYIEKKTGKKPLVYEKMRNRKLIQIVASVLFITIQCSIPSFKGSKTFPGCILSFDGFPLDGEENLRGIQYIACILDKLSSSDIKLWNSIHKIGSEIMPKQMKDLISKYMLSHPAIIAMLEKKREYLVFEPDTEIPNQLRLEKWQHFMPPLIDTDVNHKLNPISSGFIKDFWSFMRQGHRDQSKSELAIMNKMSMYGYALIEKIQEIVKSKTLILKTSGNVPFIQNACCNEEKTTKKVIEYFGKEEGSPIFQYIQTVHLLSESMYNIHLITKPPFIQNVFSNRRISIMPTEIMEENMYSAFIYYCGLDRGEIPSEFRGFFQDIPEDYHSNLPMIEKIAIIKRKKRFDIEDLNHLMRIVRKRNHLEIYNPQIANIIERFQDVLLRFDYDNVGKTDILADPMIESHIKIKNYISEMLTGYNPVTLYHLDMDTQPMVKLLNQLKEELYIANEWLYKNIIRFFRKNVNLDRKQFEKLENFLLNMNEWKIEDTGTHYYDSSFYRIQQYFKNAIYDLTHYFPALLLNRSNNTSMLNFFETDSTNAKTSKMNKRIHNYWGLSMYDQQDLKTKILEYQHELYKFQEDEVLIELIRNIQPKLIDLNHWINEMPVFSNLMKDRDYFYLFDKMCIERLDMYLIYMAMYEYIKQAGEPIIKLSERQNKKINMREKIEEQKNAALTSLLVTDEDILDEFETLEEAELMREEGEQIELNKRVGNFLMIFINMYQKNKKEVDFPYTEITNQMNKERTKEKERIMKRFSQDKEERDIEYAKKKLGLGIWNVGKQKTIFQYDKKTSDRERQEINEQNMSETVEEFVQKDIIIDEQNALDIDEIDAEDAKNADEEINAEMFDFNEYNGEYSGDYDYEEGEFSED